MITQLEIAFSEQGIVFTIENELRHAPIEVEGEGDIVQIDVGPPSIIPKQRCLNHDPQKSFEVYKLGLERLIQLHGCTLSQDVSEKHWQVEFALTEGHEDSIALGLCELMDQAFPQFTEYMQLSELIDHKLFSEAFASERSNHELITLLEKYRDSNFKQRSQMAEELKLEEKKAALAKRIKHTETLLAIRDSQAEVEFDPSLLRPYVPESIFSVMLETHSLQECAEIYEFIKRVPAENFHKLLSVINPDEYPDGYLTALKTLNVAHGVFEKENREALVYYHYLLGDLSQSEVFLVLIFDQSVRTVGREKVQLHSLTEESSLQLLKRGLVCDDNNCLTAEMFDTFSRKIPDIAKQDLRFFVVPINQFEIDHEKALSQNPPSIIEYLYHEIEQRLMLVRNGDQLQMLIVTPNLFFEILKIGHGKNAIKPNPVIGLSKPEDFQSATHRDMMIPTKLVPAPNRADGFKADPLEFLYHDLTYHISVGSTNPFRMMWIELALLAKVNDLACVWNRLLDKETPFHYQRAAIKHFAEREIHSEEAFWLGIAHNILLMKEIPEGFEKYDAEKFAKLVMQFIFLEKVRWKSEYGIELNSIAKLYLSLPLTGQEHLNLLKECAEKTLRIFDSGNYQKSFGLTRDLGRHSKLDFGTPVTTRHSGLDPEPNGTNLRKKPLILNALT